DQRRDVDVGADRAAVAACVHAHGLCLRGGGRGGGDRLGADARVRERLVEAAFLEEEVDQLVGGVGDVHRHLLHPVGEVVEHHQRRDGDQQAEGGGDERLGDADRDGGEAAGAGGGHQLEGGDDAEHRAQE